MTRENRVLYTAEPVRNAGWWLRTLPYWLLLLAQQTPAEDTWQGWLVWGLAVVPPGVAVFFRDRYPWIAALIGLLLGATIAQAPVAVAVVVMASRMGWLGTLATMFVAVEALIVPPWDRIVDSGIVLSPAGSVPDLVLFVLLPALIGAVRRSERESRRTRLRYEAEQRELAEQQAVTEERNRIAQEMHDRLGHKLSLITVQAGALEVNADGAPEVVGRQAQLIRTTSRQALDELRTILGVLGPDEADPRHPQPGLPEALALIEHHRASGMKVTVANTLPPDTELPRSVGTAIHRVVQEGLTNVVRHAPGAVTRVTLSRPDPGTVRLEMVNDRSTQRGAGPGTGRGLPGMTERVRALGGVLEAGAPNTYSSR